MRLSLRSHAVTPNCCVAVSARKRNESAGVAASRAARWRTWTTSVMLLVSTMARTVSVPLPRETIAPVAGSKEQGVAESAQRIGRLGEPHAIDDDPHSERGLRRRHTGRSTDQDGPNARYAAASRIELTGGIYDDDGRIAALEADAGRAQRRTVGLHGDGRRDRGADGNERRVRRQSEDDPLLGRGFARQETGA